MFTDFCSRCHNVFRIERHASHYTEHVCPDCKQRPVSVRSSAKDMKHPFLILFGFLAFVVGLVIIGSWGLDTGSTPNCTNTTRTIKNIQTIDDKVVEFDKQEVEGCITDDGFFIPRPDY